MKITNIKIAYMTSGKKIFKKKLNKIIKKRKKKEKKKEASIDVQDKLLKLRE